MQRSSSSSSKPHLDAAFVERGNFMPDFQGYDTLINAGSGRLRVVVGASLFRATSVGNLAQQQIQQRAAVTPPLLACTNVRGLC